jgi:hypothetical protein
VITHTNTHTLTHTNTLLIHRWKVKKYTHTWSYTVRELTKSSLSPSISLSFLFSRSLKQLFSSFLVLIFSEQTLLVFCS